MADAKLTGKFSGKDYAYPVRFLIAVEDFELLDGRIVAATSPEGLRYAVFEETRGDQRVISLLTDQDNTPGWPNCPLPEDGEDTLSGAAT